MADNPILNVMKQKQGGVLSDFASHAEKRRYEAAQAHGHAPVGGTHGVNGYFYKGGQFLPSTHEPPGKFRINGKLVKAKKFEIAPYEYAVQPTATSRAIYPIVSAYGKKKEDGSLGLYEGAHGNGVRDAKGNPVTLETKIYGEHTLGDMFSMYNKGMRWVDTGK